LRRIHATDRTVGPAPLEKRKKPAYTPGELKDPAPRSRVWEKRMGQKTPQKKSNLVCQGGEAVSGLARHTWSRSVSKMVKRGTEPKKGKKMSA